jgi:hypothetical protein
MEDKIVQVELSVEERELILKYVMLFYPGLEEKLRKKRSRNGYVRLELKGKELDDLIGCIAREANETSDRWLENELQEIFERLEDVQYKIRSEKYSLSP